MRVVGVCSVGQDPTTPSLTVIELHVGLSDILTKSVK